MDAQFLWPLSFLSHLVELGVAVAVGLALFAGRWRAGGAVCLCGFLFLLAFALSAVFSSLPRLALERVPSLLLFLAVLVAAGSEEGRERALHLLAVGAMLPVLVGLLQIPGALAGEGGFVIKGMPRIWSTFNHPNDFAFFLAVLLPAVMGLAFSSPPSGKAFLWPYVGAICLCLAFTMSRTGWLGAIAGAGLLLFTLRGRIAAREMRALFVVALVGVGLLLGMVVALGFGRALMERFLGAFSPRDPTAMSRLLMWGRSLSLFLERPLTGFGPGTFGLIYPSALRGGDLPLVSLHAHSTYIHLLVEQGSLGLLALVLLFGLALRSLKSGKVWAMASASGVASAAVASAFNHSMEIPSVGLLLWALAGVALSAFPPSRAGRAASRIFGATLALCGLALLPVTLKADLAHRLYDKAREWRLPPLEACGALRRATELDPSMPIYWAALGEASFRAGLEPHEFLPPLERAKREAPFDPWIGRLHYWGLYRAGRVDEAARRAKQVATRFFPASGLLRAEAAWLLSEAGRTEEALQLLQRPVHITHKAATEFMLAYLLEREGRTEEAKEARERMLHALRYYRPPRLEPFTAPYLRLPFKSRLPAFVLPSPKEMGLPASGGLKQ